MNNHEGRSPKHEERSSDKNMNDREDLAEEDEKLEQLVSLEKKWAELYDQNLAVKSVRQKSLIATNNHKFEENDLRIIRSPMKEASDRHLSSMSNSPYINPSFRNRRETRKITVSVRKDSSRDFELKSAGRSENRALSNINNTSINKDYQRSDKSECSSSKSRGKKANEDAIVEKKEIDGDESKKNPQTGDSKSFDDTPVIGSMKSQNNIRTILKQSKKTYVEVNSSDIHTEEKAKPNILEGKSLRSILSRNNLLRQIRRKSGERTTDAKISSYAKQFTNRVDKFEFSLSGIIRYAKNLFVRLFTRNKGRKNLKKRKTIDAEEKKINNLKILSICITSLDENKKLRKARRHFLDALNHRKVRHDIEMYNDQKTKIIYSIQSNGAWQNFLLFLSFLYLFLTFIEPTNSRDTTMSVEGDSFIAMASIEGMILFFLGIDLLGEFLSRIPDNTETFSRKYFFNKKFSLRLFAYLFCFIDAINFYAKYPDKEAPRISRYVRPFLVYFYSKELRRILMGLFHSFDGLLDVVVFFISIVLIWSFIGYKIMGDLDGEVELDPLMYNFSEFGLAASAMFNVVSFDGYPDIMGPPLQISYFYLLYFLPYLALFMLVFLPIPTAVIYDSFRKFRTKLVIRDRIKQRDALFACFMSLEPENGEMIKKDKFIQLMQNFYKKSKDENKLEDLIKSIDENESGQISVDEFLEVIDIIHSNKKYQIVDGHQLKFWKRFRTFVKQKLKIKKIVLSVKFQMFMYLIIFLNFISMMIESISDDEVLIDRLDQLDLVCLYIYIVEFFFKIIGLGIKKYMHDDWNKFDIFILSISIIFEFVINSKNYLIAGRQSKILRLVRIQKLFRFLRIFRSLIRSIKLLKWLLVGFESLRRVKNLFYRIYLCMPIAMKLFAILITVFYIYGVLGMELWNTDTNCVYDNERVYFSFYYDFNTFGGALLMLFQVCTESGWTNMIYDNTVKFGSMMLAVSYIDSFYLITNIILFALLRGLIWEIFAIISENEEKLEEEIAQNTCRSEHSESFPEFSSSQNNIDGLKSFENSNLDITINKDEFKSEPQIEKVDCGTNKTISRKSKPRNKSKKKKTAEIEQSIEVDDVDELNFTSDDFFSSDEKPGKPEDNINEERADKILQKGNSNTTDEAKNDISVPHIVKLEEKTYENINIIIQTNQSDNRSPQDLKFEENDCDMVSYTVSYFKSPVPTTVCDKINTLELKTLDQINPFIGINKPVKSHTQDEIPARVNEIYPDEGSGPQQKKLKDHEDAPFTNIFTKKETLRVDSNLSEISPVEKEKRPKEIYDMNTKDRIFMFKKKIKLLSFYSKRHIREKFKKINAIVSEANVFSDKNDYFDSDDEPFVNTYMKFIQKDIQEEENLQKNMRIQINPMESINESKNLKQTQGKNTESTKNHSYLIQKAFLKDTDMKELKNKELNYFSQKYGNFFENLKEIDIRPSLALKNKLISYLEFSLSYSNVSSKNLVSFVLHFEKMISQHLLKQGSFAKFLFRNASNKKWFALNSSYHRISFVKLKDGLWTYTDEVCHKKESIYMSHDFWNKSEIRKGPDFIKQTYESFKEAASTVAPHYLHLNIENEICDLFLIPFDNNDGPGTRDSVLKIVNRNLKKNENKNLPNSIEESDIPTHVDKILFTMMVYTGLNAIHSKDNKERAGSFGTYTKKDPDNVNMNLPFAHRIELLKNIKNVLTINKEVFFSKITELLVYKHIKDEA